MDLPLRASAWVAGLLVVSRDRARLAVERHSATRSWIIRAGGKATPPRSRATSPSSVQHHVPADDYNGPPPNYVELELQIVPFLAASLDKSFGVHEVFGRLIALAFSVGTVVVIAFLARWLFASALAG